MAVHTLNFRQCLPKIVKGTAFGGTLPVMKISLKWRLCHFIVIQINVHPADLPSDVHMPVGVNQPSFSIPSLQQCCPSPGLASPKFIIQQSSGALEKSDSRCRPHQNKHPASQQRALLITNPIVPGILPPIGRTVVDHSSQRMDKRLRDGSLQRCYLNCIGSRYTCIMSSMYTAWDVVSMAQCKRDVTPLLTH